MFGLIGAGHALYPGHGAIVAAQGAAIFGLQGTRISRHERDFFRDADPWGFILFARNIETPDQVRALCAELRATVGRNAPILIDQEGGRVARLGAPHWREWLPALDQMRAVGRDHGPRAMWLRYRLIAAELADIGIDTNCAPLGDIATPAVHPVLRDRCYGFDVETVTTAARAVADGLLAGGVLPVVKHIPGHGRPSADSHTDLPGTDAGRADLVRSDFAAFRALSDLPLAMTAHVVYHAIDPANCATHSAEVIAMVRAEIGFDGLLMTDDLSMAALKGTMAERACAARRAGCDLVLHCNASMGEMIAAADGAGRLDDDGVRRAGAALAARKPPDAMNAEHLLAELADLLC